LLLTALFIVSSHSLAAITADIADPAKAGINLFLEANHVIVTKSPLRAPFGTATSVPP
jgi:hypothetical protein